MKKSFLAAIIITCILLTGCGVRADDTPHRRTVFAMDTVMNLTAYGRGAQRGVEDAEDELYRLDAVLSRAGEKSAVRALNETGEADDPELAALLSRAAEISRATLGAFDPTVAPVLALWGFGAGSEERRVPEEAELLDALSRVGAEAIGVSGSRVTLSPGAAVDLGGIAKGYAGERVRQLLGENGVKSAVIDLGGDVALLGGKPDGSPWRVAIKDPNGGADYLGILEAEDCFVVTSGVYERQFEENGVTYHHIIDPATGYPADSGVVSATVVCADGLWADALATAVSVMGAERALALRAAAEVPFSLILVTDEGRVLLTQDLAERFQEGNGAYAYEYVA